MHQVADTCRRSSHITAVYRHICSQFQTTVYLSVNVGTYIELVVVGIDYQSVFIMIVECQRVSYFVSTAFDTQVVVVEQAVFT